MTGRDCGDFGGDTAWDFNSLTFSGGGTTNTTGTGSITVAGVLTNSHTLEAGTKTWSLTGNGTPFVNSGTFTPETSKISYDNATSATVTGETYYDLEFNPASGTPTFTLPGAGPSYSAGTLTGLSWPAFKNSKAGPFEVDGILYVFGLDATNWTLECWSSTDNGANWSEVDAANHPSAINGTSEEPSDSLDVQLVGDTFYLLYQFGSPFRIRKFSTTTDTWQSLESGMSTGAPTSSTHITGAEVAMLAVRGDGDYVVLHQGSTESISGTDYRRTVYSRFQSGAWTTNIDVGGTGDQVHKDARAILRSTGRTHLFYTKSSGGLFVKTLLDNNTLGTEVTVSASVFHTVAYTAGLPVFSDELVVPFRESGGLNPLKVARSSDSDTTSWSVDSEVVATAIEDATANLCALVSDGEATPAIYALYVHAASDDLFIANDAGAADGWTGNEEIDPAATAAGVSANLLTGAVGYLYDDGGTIKFNAYSTAVGGGSITTNNNFVLTGAGTATVDTDTNDTEIDVDGDFSILNGVFEASDTGLFTIAGNFTNDDTFTHNNGTVTLDTTGTSQLAYTANTTFYGLDISVGGKAMQFDEAQQTIITNDLNIQGTDCTTGRIFLDSITNDNLWDIVVTGATVDIDFVDVEDSNAVTTAITANNSTEDNDNNTNWTVNACGAGPTLDQLMRHGGWFNGGVEQPFTF